MKSLMKPNFAYIFTNNLDHPGLKLKYYGQLTAFRKKYTVKSVWFNWTSSDWQLKKLGLYLYFECRSLIAIITSKTIYLRYNPKLFITNYLLPYFTSKTIYLEINTIFELQLKLLNRLGEQCVNTFFMKHFKGLKHIIYVGVTKQIQQDMIDRYGADQRCTRFIQNGYYPPDVNKANVDQECLARVKAFQEKFQKIGIFVGGGYIWHGLDDLIKFSKSQPSIGFLVISINNIQIDCDNVLVLTKQTPDTIREIYQYCHFGISSFKTNLIGIYEGCPLKTREYLYNGLVILTHNLDCSEYIDALKPYVFNMKQNPDSFKLLLAINKKATISKLASQYLSWDVLLQDI